MKITRGRIPCGQKVVIYGVEGIGKTTLAAQFPGAVFIDTEGSTRNFDVARFEAPTSWEMLKAEAQYPIDHPDEIGTLVIDTADWAEKLCQRSICLANSKASIEGWDYGKGYTMSAEEFGRLLDILDRVISAGVHVVITAHATIRKVESPTEFGSYDKYELKCSRQVSPMLKEWADMVLFCNYKMMIVTEKGKRSGRAQGGQRMMYANHCPAYDAKNRHGLPDELPMDFGQIAHIFHAQSALAPATVPAPQTSPPETVFEPSVSAAQEEPANPTPVVTGEVQAVPATETPTPAPDVSAGEPPCQPGEAPPFTFGNSLEGIYPPLADLLRTHEVLPSEIQLVVGAKGYMPTDMPVQQYPLDFVQGCLIGAWDSVYACVLKDRQEIPF